MTTAKLIQYIKDKGYSRTEIKAKCGIANSTLVDWEQKGAQMKWETACMIFQTLGLSMREYLKSNNIR
jgi:DNA-binding XRE family transcriptional regulator